MDGIKIEVTGNIARVIEKPQRITVGTVGLPVEFTFDSQWEGLEKSAVFLAGCQQMAVEMDGSTIVPWEILRKPGVRLSIGACGLNADGSVAITTVWATVGTVYAGANLGLYPSTEPTITLWKKLQNAIGNLLGLKTDSKDNLVNAINEVYDKEEATNETIGNMLSDIRGLQSDVDDLDDLNTNAKGNLVDAINEVNDRAIAAGGGHNHDDRYYTEAEIDAMLVGMPVEGHNHDNRYYTETEVDNLLGGKAPTTHKHTKDEITDFPTNMTPTAHTHKKSEITDFPTTETWTFTLEDGSTVTKAVYVG